MQKANKQVAQVCKLPQNDQYLEHTLMQVVQREDLSQESLKGGGAAGQSGVHQGGSEEEAIGTQTRLSSTIKYGQFSKSGKLPTSPGNVPDLRTGQGDGADMEKGADAQTLSAEIYADCGNFASLGLNFTQICG